MTEAEWLECTEPHKMLEFLRGTDRDLNRKLRLFAVACCRRVLSLAPSQRTECVLEVAERLADGQATNAERRAAAVGIKDHQAVRAGGDGWRAACYSASVSAGDAAQISSTSSESAVGVAVATARYGPPSADHWDSTFLAAVDEGRRKEKTTQTLLLRDIFGSVPFRVTAVDASWLSWNHGTVVNLAQAIYDERTFDRLPVLADALEEAGCHDTDILTHCRQQGEHLRGCWIVDLLLGKS